MTINCIKELKNLRETTDGLFNNLSLEQLLYECLRSNNWERDELIFVINDLIKEKKKILKLETK